VQSLRSINLRVVGVWALATAALLWVPLLNVLHAEAAAVIATVAFFASGLDAVSKFRRTRSRVRSVVETHLTYLVVPFLVYQVARLWMPGCSFVAGVKFYMLFPVVSVIFAVAVAFLLTGLPLRRTRLWFTVVGLAIATVPVVYDLGFHPQFYTYNHIFGGVLGPVYDFELTVRPGLVAFRLLTLLWSGLAIIVGHRVREPIHHGLTGVSILTVGIAWFYLFPGTMGINTTYGQLADALGSERRTDHFVIHYDSSAVSPAEIEYMAADHEFRYYQLTERLGFEPGSQVHSYLYPTSAKRAKLTGAGRTNIAPVWLKRPQVHVLQEVYSRSFSHELAHVFSREMGLPLLNASLHVGLVEGFAVAMEAPGGLPSPDDQVASLARSPTRTGLYRKSSVAESVASTLSPAGFWTGRGAVTYTTMGSFVDYLISEFGVPDFSRVYAMESFGSVYGKSVGELAAVWEDRLLELETSERVSDLASRRFSVPSLFERRCPHDTPPSHAAFREGQLALTMGDSVSAIRWFKLALDEDPKFVDALGEWATLELAEGRFAGVVRRIGSVWSDDRTHTIGLSVRFGDALVLSGRPEQAATAYGQGLERASPFSRNGRSILKVRTLLVDRPDVLAVVVSTESLIVKAETLSRFHDPTGAATILASLFLAEADEFQVAADRLAEARGTLAAEVIDERYPAWLSAFSYRAGRLMDAERHRQSASQAALSAGDREQLVRLEDFQDRIDWARNRVEV
jgi:hypothetical protein